MIKYQCGYKYRLYETAFFRLPTEFHGYEYHSTWLTLTASGDLTIREGYSWNGPSGPTIDTKDFHQGALVHDVLYQLMREHHLPRTLKDAADTLLKDFCLEDGMWRIRAWLVHKAVQKFGLSSTIKNQNIMVAP